MRMKSLSYFAKKEEKVATVQNVEICHYLKKKVKMLLLIAPNFCVQNFKSTKHIKLLYIHKVS